MISTGNPNEVQKVSLGGAASGAIWTGAGALAVQTVADVTKAIVDACRGGNGGGAPRGGCGGGGYCEGVSPAVVALQAEVAKLQAEKYSDNAARQESDRLLTQWFKPYGNEIADAKVREARLEAEVDCLKKVGELREEILRKDIQLVEQRAQCCCNANATAIAAVAAKVDAITGVYVPNSALQPGVPTVQVVHPTTTTTTTGA